MSITRSKIRSRKQVRPESSFDSGDMDRYISLLNRASLQCRLFGKEIEIIYHKGNEDLEVTTSSWTTSSGKLILNNGKVIPLKAIKSVYVL